MGPKPDVMILGLNTILPESGLATRLIINGILLSLFLPGLALDYRAGLENFPVWIIL